MEKININTKNDSKIILEHIRSFNYENLPINLRDSYKELNFNIKDNKEEIIAGILSEICWNWLEIKVLWINENYRKQSLGTQLLKKIEKIAKENSCEYIKLDTFEFQSLEFYLKNNYEIYGKIINSEKGLTHYYLIKKLK